MKKSLTQILRLAHMNKTATPKYHRTPVEVTIKSEILTPRLFYPGIKRIEFKEIPGRMFAMSKSNFELIKELSKYNCPMKITYKKVAGDSLPFITEIKYRRGRLLYDKVIFWLKNI